MAVKGSHSHECLFVTYLHSHALCVGDSSDSKERKHNIKTNSEHITYQWWQKCLIIFYVWTLTVVLKFCHLWDISLIFLSQNENLKSNLMLTWRNKSLWLCKTQAVFTFSFTFFSTEAPKDIFLKVLLSFWLVKSEVQHELPVLWLVERERDLMSCMVPGLCVTVRTHKRFEWLKKWPVNARIENILASFLRWHWTSKQDLGCCGCLQLVDGWVWPTGPGDTVRHCSGLGERLKLAKQIQIGYSSYLGRQSHVLMLKPS